MTDAHLTASCPPIQRRMTLIRHATAEPLGSPDHARPLSAQGLHEAEALGAWLHTQSEQPTHWICSTAARATETLDALHLPPTAQIALLDAAYLASAEELLALLYTLPESCTHVGIIAHNPGLFALAARGASEHPTEASEQLLTHGLEPAAYACCRVMQEGWKALTPEDLLLETFRRP